MDEGESKRAKAASLFGIMALASAFDAPGMPNSHPKRCCWQLTQMRGRSQRVRRKRIRWKGPRAKRK